MRRVPAFKRIHHADVRCERGWPVGWRSNFVERRAGLCYYFRSTEEGHMTDTVDLNRALFLERFLDLLDNAADTCAMDAHMLREAGGEARVWEIVAEELMEAADRIKRRTAGLPSVQR